MHSAIVIRCRTAEFLTYLKKQLVIYSFYGKSNRWDDNVIGWFY
jgi:hypothetical protein